MRLPGKVLLPVGGLPVVVLAARRASNTGRQVIVAISNEVTDDPLAELLTESDIRFYRGSMENTLQRIVNALENYSDNTLVFRLTSDNVFPDGLLMDEMEEDFIQRGLKYLCCNGEDSGLPYGVSAELMRLECLREAANATQSKYDQEHVTPYISRKFGSAFFERYKYLNKGHFRCTIDCLEDYQVVRKVFSEVRDPIKVSVFELIERLNEAPYQPKHNKPASKLVLGTAQLGSDYGIANCFGKPDRITAERLIKEAIVNGVAYIDTARAYGSSEEVIGGALKRGWIGRAKVITKLSPLSDCPTDASTATINAYVDASVFGSCRALGVHKIDVMLLHCTSHLSDWSGTVWARLLEHKSDGTLETLGASVQSPQELEKALSIPEIEVIQMPFNILDWRWDGLISRVRTTKLERSLIIHVRSALLQGLIPSRSIHHWQKANVRNPALIIEWLHSISQKAGRTTVADFCLSFVKSLDWVDGVVVGMETLGQLHENVRSVSSNDLSDEEVINLLANRPILHEKSLNPGYWIV